MLLKVFALVAHSLLAGGAILATLQLGMRGEIPGSTAVAAITTFAGLGTGGSVASLYMSNAADTINAAKGK